MIDPANSEDHERFGRAQVITEELRDALCEYVSSFPLNRSCMTKDVELSPTEKKKSGFGHGYKILIGGGFVPTEKSNLWSGEKTGTPTEDLMATDSSIHNAGYEPSDLFRSQNIPTWEAKISTYLIRRPSIASNSRTQPRVRAFSSFRRPPANFLSRPLARLSALALEHSSPGA